MNVGILNKAIEEAYKSEHTFRLGAVLFKSGRIFGVGHNSNRYSSSIPEKYRKFPNSCHAEMAAIMNTQNWDKLNGSSILVIRLNSKGDFALSYPCKYCKETLIHLGIKWVYYTTKEGEIRKERINA
jgi:deoxycytidylate deaminase